MAVRASQDHIALQAHMLAHKKAIWWKLEDLEEKVEGLTGETQKRAKKVLDNLKACLDQLEDPRPQQKNPELVRCLVLRDSGV